MNDVPPRVRGRHYLLKPEFLRLSEWKTVRSRSRCARNPEARIEEATRLALSASDESVKIGLLRILEGVDWPTASVILHFCDHRPYPILDYRALWSLGFDSPPTYSYSFWEQYTAYVRELADRTGHSMRTIDRALWQYSNENQ